VRKRSKGGEYSLVVNNKENLRENQFNRFLLTTYLKKEAGTRIHHVHTFGSLIPPHSEKLSRLALSHLALQMFEYCLPFLSLQSEEGGAVQVLSEIILGCD